MLHHISIRVSEELYKNLQLKAQEMGKLKLSDALRILLRDAIKKPKQNKKRKPKGKELQYIITTYYLMKEFIVSSGEHGSKINNKAHEAAEKILTALVQ